MAIIQSTGFYKGMATGCSLFEHTTNANNRITIYQNIGNMPADADDWSIAGSAADELVTFTNGFDISTPSLTNLSGDVENPNWGRIQFTDGQGPSSATPSATGTAAWYAMYDHPSSPTDWLIGDVSLVSGTATLKLDSLSLTSGVAITIASWGITFKA